MGQSRSVRSEPATSDDEPLSGRFRARKSRQDEAGLEADHHDSWKVRALSPEMHVQYEWLPANPTQALRRGALHGGSRGGGLDRVKGMYVLVARERTAAGLQSSCELWKSRSSFVMQDLIRRGRRAASSALPDLTRRRGDGHASARLHVIARARLHTCRLDVLSERNLRPEGHVREIQAAMVVWS